MGISVSHRNCKWDVISQFYGTVPRTSCTVSSREFQYRLSCTVHVPVYQYHARRLVRGRAGMESDKRLVVEEFDWE